MSSQSSEFVPLLRCTPLTCLLLMGFFFLIMGIAIGMMFIAIISIISAKISASGHGVSGAPAGKGKHE